jgi:pimeloyl-ACP methyl ester carboxylesterase
MPVPLRDDGTPGPETHLVVFVHGFASDAQCWEVLQSLLGADSRFAGYEFRCYQYPTAFVQLRFLRRIPRLKELGSGLRAFLEPLLRDRYVDVTLIGHSQGGLVIQSYLADELTAGRGLALASLRQVILLGTPNAGSTIASPVRKLLFGAFSNPQERILRVLDDEIADIRRIVQERVVEATARQDHTLPVPIHAFWGQQDRIVLESSARGSFTSSAPLSGDHFGIIRPAGADDPDYDAISRAILEPVGHRHIFEIERFVFSITVAPREGADLIARYGRHERTVQSDNVAHVVRSAEFSHGNRCSSLFTIKYLTRNSGFIEPRMNRPNEASPDFAGRWKDEGTAVYYQFHPRPGETYELDMTVFKGFDEGHRDVHHHCGRQSYYRHYECVVDLSAYVKAGWIVIQAPELFYLPFDPDHDELCGHRNRSHPDPPVEAQDGRWRWDLEFLREGVVDVRWELRAPAGVRRDV